MGCDRLIHLDLQREVEAAAQIEAETDPRVREHTRPPGRQGNESGEQVEDREAQGDGRRRGPPAKRAHQAWTSFSTRVIWSRSTLRRTFWPETSATSRVTTVSVRPVTLP